MSDYLPKTSRATSDGSNMVANKRDVKVKSWLHVQKKSPKRVICDIKLNNDRRIIVKATSLEYCSSTQKAGNSSTYNPEVSKLSNNLSFGICSPIRELKPVTLNRYATYVYNNLTVYSI